MLNENTTEPANEVFSLTTPIEEPEEEEEEEEEDSSNNAHILPPRTKGCIPHPYPEPPENPSFYGEFTKCCNCGLTLPCKSGFDVSGPYHLPKIDCFACGHTLHIPSSLTTYSLNEKCGLLYLGWRCWACSEWNGYLWDDFENGRLHSYKWDVDVCGSCEFVRDAACPFGLQRLDIGYYCWVEWW